MTKEEARELIKKEATKLCMAGVPFSLNQLLIKDYVERLAALAVATENVEDMQQLIENLSTNPNSMEVLKNYRDKAVAELALLKLSKELENN